MSTSIHLDLGEAKHPVSASYKGSDGTIRITYSDGTFEYYMPDWNNKICGPGVLSDDNNQYTENGVTVSIHWPISG